VTAAATLHTALEQGFAPGRLTGRHKAPARSVPVRPAASEASMPPAAEVLLYVPNLIGYARLACIVYGFHAPGVYDAAVSLTSRAGSKAAHRFPTDSERVPRRARSAGDLPTAVCGQHGPRWRRWRCSKTTQPGSTIFPSLSVSLSLSLSVLCTTSFQVLARLSHSCRCCV
jgi:hypothetical protein